MLKHYITGYSITLDVTEDQLRILDSLDFLTEVEPILADLGAERIEFDAHFGPHVLFTVTHKSMIKPIKSAIEMLISKECL